MDLAELRKKAKSQLPTNEEPGDSLVPPATLSSPVQPEDNEADVVGEPSAIVTAEKMDPIEELFKIPQDLQLLSREQSLKELDGKTDGEQKTLRQWLVFSLGREEYGLDINHIREIIKPREITDIPRVPDFILGIISLRGVVVPIYDLKKRLGLGFSGISTTTRIVVCEHEGLLAGLQVDCISRVVRLADERIESTPGMLTGIDREMVRGIGRQDGKMMVLLDLPHILDTNFN